MPRTIYRASKPAGSALDNSWVEVGNVNNSPYLEVRRQGSTQSGVKAFIITATANSPQQIFTISYNGSIASLNTTINQISSERRLKENIVAVDPTVAWETIKSVPCYQYNFIGQPAESKAYGPMADEVPDEMRVATDRSDEQGVIHTYDNAMLQGRLYTALQAALKRIEELRCVVRRRQLIGILARHRSTYGDSVPDNPSVGDPFSAEGITYTWDGTVWIASGSAAFATVAQGELADTALQPGEAATPAQGALADTAVQPGDDVSGNAARLPSWSFADSLGSGFDGTANASGALTGVNITGAMPHDHSACRKYYCQELNSARQ